MLREVKYSLSKLMSQLDTKDDFAYFSIQKVSAEKICERNNISPTLYRATSRDFLW